jgi:DNA-binding FadR family transcriptional regulator
MIRPRTAKLYEQITPQIARDIVSRRLPPGATIPSEPQLVATFGVSKTVARETVQVLEAAGLVRVQHGRRTVVLDEQEWNILSPLIQEAYRTENLAGPLIGELYEVRLQLEPQAAHWAAERATPLEVQQIRDILEAMRQSLSAKHPFLTHDQEFHIAVVQAAANRVLRAVLRDLHEVLISSWVMTDLNLDDLHTVFAQHQRIADAIIASNGPDAERAMRDHLEWAVVKDRSATTVLAFPGTR